MPEVPTLIYVCRRCFSTAAEPGICPNCGLARVECNPGDLDNPCRRPPMDSDGRLLSRAPLWWLLPSAPFLRHRVPPPG